jgi:hypothetical protein
MVYAKEKSRSLALREMAKRPKHHLQTGLIVQAPGQIVLGGRYLLRKRDLSPASTLSREVGVAGNSQQVGERGPGFDARRLC